MSRFLQMTVGGLLEEMTAAHPDHEALVYSDRDLKYTFAELDRRVTQIAKGLMAIGIQKGDHVGIWATNVPDWIPIDAVEVKIVDVNTGEDLPPHQPGELCSRGYNTMNGYYKMPEETARAIDPGGWLHTGDLAVMIENNYYRITGRLKDMVIRGGENIYPKEVEDFLLGVTEIRNVQIVGVPNDMYGEEVAAFVQLHPGANLEPSEIPDYCRGKIARYKIPKHIYFIDDFPMTASGKIQKYKLREMATQLVAEQKEKTLEEDSSVTAN